MDNLSHSVASLAAGELLHRLLPRESSEDTQRLRHRLLLVVCGLAGNFPDLDLLFTPLLPTPLGYLLHHRGHTHTLLYAIPQGLLLCTLILAFWPHARALLKNSISARTGFALATVAGFILHLTMDYLNSYGLHPFHPFDSRWLYGDMVFILEPVFWIAFGIPLAMLLPRVGKIGAITLLLGVPMYFTLTGFLAWGSFFALLLLAAALAVLQSRIGTQRPHGLLAAFAVALLFITGQGVASQQARITVERNLHSSAIPARIVDVAMTAFPSNPLCWTFVSIEQDEAAGIYRLTRGVASVDPRLLPVAACPSALIEQGKAASAGTVLYAQAQGSLRELRELMQSNCHFAAWLRFARAPLLDGLLASDLRFASAPRGNFTTLDLEEFGQKECPNWIPQWEFPRADMLAAPGTLPSGSGSAD